MDVINAIQTLGYPIVVSLALAYFCKYMIDMNNKNIEKMFEMYAKANEENRTAIEACTKAIDRLCDRLEKENKDE